MQAEEKTHAQTKETEAMKALRVFIGVDQRQPVAYSVLQHSIWRRASQPVAISPIKLDTLPLTRTGLTEFTFSRYLVPWLCDYEGWALFLDSDMLVLDDIAQLFALADESKAVMVVQNIQRFEWPSLMLFNCAKCTLLDPEYVQKYPSPQDFMWAGGKQDEAVGTLPAQWNHCVGYDAPRTDAKLVHYTQGIPLWFETQNCEYGAQWREEFADMERACAWKEIMAASVHAKPVLERMLRMYGEAAVAQMKELQARKEQQEKAA
jgi:lipopolysaccharide biosynthesis glycosyltransferase